MEPIVHIRGLTKRYGNFLLDIPELVVPAGFIMGIVGRNGAGKTTLLQLLLNIVTRDEGSILVFGEELLANEAAVKRRMGWVAEQPRFHTHLTVRQCAGLHAAAYPTWDEATFRRLAERFGLPFRRRIASLSRGSRTRLALALALSHRAELLVLDEPTTGLDPVFRRELLELLADQLQDERKAVVFSTQVTSDLDRIADYITYLEEGRLRFSAGKEDIRARWAIIKGGPELLADPLRRHLLVVRPGAYGCEALTLNLEAVRPLLRQDSVVEPPLLEEVMVLMSGPSGITDEGRTD